MRDPFCLPTRPKGRRVGLENNDPHGMVFDADAQGRTMGLIVRRNRLLLTGTDLLHNPRFNKGTAFTDEEKEALGLHGLVPEGTDDEETQLKRVLGHIAIKSTDVGRYTYLSELQDRNETLFYKVLMSDPARFVPLVYTPTVGEACLQFGHILRRPKGMYLSIKRRGRVREILRNWPEQDVQFIVVTDGERILGLGDLGTNGMGIPIGKLALYTACGGVPPQFTLPVTLDVGTNNEALLRDPLYLGLRQPRVRGEEYDAFVDEFVEAVQGRYPKCCIQFEDFIGANAVPILERWSDRVCCFNDDIQGTAATAVAGIFAAMRIKGERVRDQRILFLGAGAAGTGIATLLVSVMRREGLSESEARGRIWLFDVNGLVTADRDDLLPFQKPFAHAVPPVPDFLTAVERFKPSAIIGVSTAAKAFDRRVIESMARINERPIIFPFSNPTSRSECTAEEAFGWSGGRVIFASGSPFPPVTIGGRTFIPGQGNNVYIFPGIGLAVFATESRRVTEEMFICAAQALAEQCTDAELATGLIYPPQSRLLQSNINLAVRVAELVFASGLARVPAPADVDTWVRDAVYRPEYPNLLE